MKPAHKLRLGFAISLAAAAVGCSSGLPGASVPQLGTATVDLPATGDILLSIVENDEIGSVKYYGARRDGAHDITSFEVDAGDENFVVVLDAQDRPTEITIGDLRITFVYDPDGTFGYTATLAGAVVSGGEDLLPGENYLSAKCKSCAAARIDREVIAGCVADKFEEPFNLGLMGVSDPLRGCLLQDEVAIRLATTWCVTKLVLDARLDHLAREPHTYPELVSILATYNNAIERLNLFVAEPLLYRAVELAFRPECGGPRARRTVVSEEGDVDAGEDFEDARAIGAMSYWDRLLIKGGPSGWFWIDDLTDVYMFTPDQDGVVKISPGGWGITLRRLGMSAEESGRIREIKSGIDFDYSGWEFVSVKAGVPYYLSVTLGVGDYSIAVTWSSEAEAQAYPELSGRPR